MFDNRYKQNTILRWLTRYSILCFVTLSFAGYSHAQEEAGFARGFELYGNHCTACHTSVVHVRERRKAGSLEAIEAYILRWKEYQNLTWTKEEVRDVLTFLNKRYYKF